MITSPLKIGAWRYEPTEALLDGQVTVEGFDSTVESAPIIIDLFQRILRGDLDVSELGLTFLLRALDAAEESSLLALPIFPPRHFLHSAIFINVNAGIEQPQDLVGKTVGEFALYGHDAGMWPRGILSDEYGVRPEQCSWVIGGTNYPIPSPDWIPQPVPAGVQVRHLGDGQTLGPMLQSGEIDALISVEVPQALLDGSTQIRRLFPDHATIERDYFRRTGIFPMMHTVAIRRELVDEPGLVEAVYSAFTRSKDVVAQRYREGAATQHMGQMMPWISELFADNRALLGEDWWPYGITANRPTIEAFLRYHHEQGLTWRLLRVEDIFVPQLLAT